MDRQVPVRRRALRLLSLEHCGPQPGIRRGLKLARKRLRSNGDDQDVLLIDRVVTPDRRVAGAKRGRCSNLPIEFFATRGGIGPRGQQSARGVPVQDPRPLRQFRPDRNGPQTGTAGVSIVQPSLKSLAGQLPGERQALLGTRTDRGQPNGQRIEVIAELAFLDTLNLNLAGDSYPAGIDQQRPDGVSPFVRLARLGFAQPVCQQPASRQPDRCIESGRRLDHREFTLAGPAQIGRTTPNKRISPQIRPGGFQPSGAGRDPCLCLLWHRRV